MLGSRQGVPTLPDNLPHSFKGLTTGEASEHWSSDLKWIYIESQVARKADE